MILIIEKLIFFEHAVETLGYFSKQLAEAFGKLGYQTFFVDYHALERSMKLAGRFCRPRATAVVTFNFIGLSGEDYCMEPDGRSFWEARNLPCFCIMVDHPLYYYKQLCKMHRNLTVFCVDRGHVAYMKRHFPQYLCYFLPLAGNRLLKEEAWIPYRKRKYGIAFIANYVSLPDIETHFRSQTQEYIDFYNEILADMRKNPTHTLDATLERFILREEPSATDAQLVSGQAGLLFLDLYIRTFYRELAVRSLVDSGLKVHVFGKGWENMQCAHPENLVMNQAFIDSESCVRVIRNTRLALNVMPWFKDGAHDRIFTAMLNGAVSLTDDSIYLREILRDGENTAFYHLENMTELTEKAKLLLTEEDAAEAYTKEAYEYAVSEHTWEKRAGALDEMLRSVYSYG